VEEFTDQDIWGLSHDMIRAARFSAPRIATATIRLRQQRLITTLSCFPVSHKSTATATPTYTRKRAFWNKATDTSAMASATSFFDFKPKDSTSSSPLCFTTPPRAS
jgi:hypothetical protein